MPWRKRAMHPAFYRGVRNTDLSREFRAIHTAILHSVVEALGEFRTLKKEEKEEGNHLLSEGSAAEGRALYYQIISHGNKVKGERI